MILYDPKKQIWYNPNIEYIFNTEIIEYDIQNAGINIIKTFNLLSLNQIQDLMKLDKLECHIQIGKLQRNDKEFSKTLLEKFAEIREKFISANSLNEQNILSVKKDAIYTIKSCDKLKFGKIEFVEKNIYSSYIRFPENSNIEIYYSSNKIDIKGIGEIGLNIHRLYLLMFLKKIISLIESKDNSIKRYFINFIDKYKQLELDEGYYIKFNNMSKDYDPVYNYQKLLIPLTQIILKEFK